jgi:hypothetical protein
MNEYLAKGDKKLIGLIEMYDEKSFFSWGKDVRWPPSSEYWVAIFERK